MPTLAERLMQHAIDLLVPGGCLNAPDVLWPSGHYFVSAGRDA